MKTFICGYEPQVLARIGVVLLMLYAKVTGRFLLHDFRYCFNASAHPSKNVSRLPVCIYVPMSLNFLTCRDLGANQS